MTLMVQSASKIIRNFASDEGGGIYSDDSSTVTISPDSTVAKNIPNDKNF
jgi:predicted outer membrane repeat protein